MHAGWILPAAVEASSSLDLAELPSALEPTENHGNVVSIAYNMQ